MDVALLHYPLDGADKPLCPAPKPVVEPKPSEQDLDFTIGPHFTIVQNTNELASRWELGCAGAEDQRSTSRVTIAISRSQALFRFGTVRPVQRFYRYQSLWGSQQMQEYRAFIMGPDGHVQSRVDRRCNDEDEAVALARQLVDGHDVELWQLDRQIEIFRHTSERPILRQSITADGAR